MDANDLTPADREALAHALRTPAIREVLEFLDPPDLQSRLYLVRELERLQRERQQEARFIRTLRTVLSQPGALDYLRGERAEPAARWLLLAAYRLGLMDGSR
jgi:transposase